MPKKKRPPKPTVAQECGSYKRGSKAYRACEVQVRAAEKTAKKK